MDECHLCIVGAGMIGSAAARYASIDPTLKVCLIGPDEPEDLNSRDIFSAHYDEGRVTRIIDVDPICQQLAKASISRYTEIEKLSGISFYDPVGTIFIGEKDAKYTVLMQQACINGNVVVEDISEINAFNRKFPFMKLLDDEVVLLDSGGAGHISARNLVAAQQQIAGKQGCVIIRDIVSNIEECVQSMGLTKMKVTTDSGNVILAQRILICTGAFTNCRQLLPNYRSLVPNMKITQDTVALLEISEQEAQRLRAMPSILYDRENYPGLSHSIGAYILPPIKYPDGKWYLKIGHGSEFEKEVHTVEEIKEWYLSPGNSRVIEEYANILKNLLPGLKVISTKGKTCVTSHTPSALPYIDRITPVLTVAIAGNGKGAKMSDELGRIAAYLCIKGEWNSPLPRSLFSFQWKPHNF